MKVRLLYALELSTGPIEVADKGGRKGGPKTAKPHRNTPKTANRIGFFPEYRNAKMLSFETVAKRDAILNPVPKQ